MTSARLGVVIVLYRTAFADSLTIRSLFSEIGGLRDHFFIIVRDNSGDARPQESEFASEIDDLSTDVSNPGLASAYNDAAGKASAAGCDWLMLLDQDTALTHEFLSEVLLAAREVDPTVGTMVPRLVHGDRLLSPHGRVRLRATPVTNSGPVPSGTVCSHYNSGSVLRLKAIDAVGRFPTTYALDYLDHAMAANLRSGGFDIHVLRSRLTHNPAILEPKSVDLSRFRSILRSEEHFYAQYGSRADRAWLLMRRVVGLGLVMVRYRSTPSLREEILAIGQAWRVLANRPGTA